MVAYVMWLLIVLSPRSGVPTVVWDYDSQKECVQAGQRYREFACVRVVVKTSDFQR